MPWFLRRKWEKEMNEELRDHIDRQVAANIASGMAPAEARRQAALRMGALEGVKDGCREQRRGFWLETILADMRYAARMLRSSPGFTAISILTIALGIGSTTAIFSVVDATLLHPLQYPHPDQLVGIEDDLPGVGAEEIEIVFARNVLLIAGRKLPRPLEDGGAAFHVAERAFGRFARAITLDGAYDTDRATATLIGGELRLVLPCQRERRGGPIRIPVRTP